MNSVAYIVTTNNGLSEEYTKEGLKCVDSFEALFSCLNELAEKVAICVFDCETISINESQIQKLLEHKSVVSKLYAMTSNPLTYKTIGNLYKIGFDDYFLENELMYHLSINHEDNLVFNQREDQTEKFFIINSNLYNLPIGISIENIDTGHIIFKNPKFENFLFLNDNGCILKHLGESESLQPLEILNKLKDKVLDNNQAIVEVVEIINTDKSKSYLNIFCHNVYNKVKNSNYITTLFRDVTTEYAQILEDRRLRSRHDKLISISTNGVIYINPESDQIVDINEQLLDFTGYDRSELIDITAIDLPIWKSKEHYLELKSEILELKSIKFKEIKLLNKHRDEKSILISAEFFIAEDEPLIIISGFDISDKVKATQALSIAEATQNELNKLKTSFISMISHEFRTPLTTIQLSNEVLRRYIDRWTPDERNKHFDRIQSTVLKMTKLLENVLIISKIDNGSFIPNLEEIDIASYCSTLAETIEFNSNGTHTISFASEANNILTRVDENILGLILTNLLTNAVKYSPKDSIVEFVLEQTETEAKFTIKDNGIGIPEEDLKNLFEAFYRAKNVGPIDGYGLGLSLVKKSVEAHKGNILVSSQINVGTTFVVSLPTNLKQDDFLHKN